MKTEDQKVIDAGRILELQEAQKFLYNEMGDRWNDLCKTLYEGRVLAAMYRYKHTPGWISVTESLPELTEQVYWYNDENERVPWEGKFIASILAYDPEIGIFKAEFDGKRFVEKSSVSIRGTVNPTLWHPLPSLPSPPKE